MTQVREFYGKFQKPIENILFPVLLILYPLIGINQGIDVSDTTYSLANFQYFGDMEGTWLVATFLANAAGSLLMRLPFAGTMPGMNLYTSLVQSALALTVYLTLRRKIPAPLLAVGEWTALGLCWCPSVILYNYLTYFLMTVGMLLLYSGILEEREGRRRICYVAAGICLGANVAVRMPNVVQAAFILAVWYGAWTDPKGRSFFRQTVLRSTLWCVFGYLLGFLTFLGAICIRYGVRAYPAMVQTMFAMTEKAKDYKPASMLTGMLGDYGRGLYWLLFAGICMAAGWLLLRGLEKVRGKSFPGRTDREASCPAGGGFAAVLCRVCYGAFFLVLLRFYWGRGMFSFRYYEYGSIYYPAVLLLLVTVFAAVWCLVTKDVPRERKVFAALVLLELFLTPLGSNNALYPIINNLFLAVPFVLWTASEQFVMQHKAGAGCEESMPQRGVKLAGIVQKSFVWKTPFVVLCLFVFAQSVGFHTHFAFQDGIWGEVRDTRINAPAKASGVYTNQNNGELLEELAVYAQTAGLSDRRALLYGDIPGLGYLLDMPAALSTFWPDLDSYRLAEFERDMARIEEGIAAGEEMPVVILASPVAAYLSEDADAMNWFGIDQEKLQRLQGDEKLRQLKAFMDKQGYEESFVNAGYAVYENFAVP